MGGWGRSQLSHGSLPWAILAQAAPHFRTWIAHPPLTPGSGGGHLAAPATPVLHRRRRERLCWCLAQANFLDGPVRPFWFYMFKNSFKTIVTFSAQADQLADQSAFSIVHTAAQAMHHLRSP